VHLELSDAALRVRKGVYTSRARWEEAAEWERYLIRVHALAQARPDAVFSHESAAALWGLPLFGHPRDVHVFDARRSRSLRYGDVTVHTSEDERSFVEHGGLRITSPDDTVLDLVRCLPAAFGLAVVDAALRAFPDAVTPDGLRALSAQRRNIRGRARIHWAVDRADARAESVGESVSRAVIEWWGFPEPQLQHAHVIEGRTYRSDFAWPYVRVVGESDGWEKYGTAMDDARRVVKAEKRRENDLRRDGWTVARWDFAEAVRGTGLRDALLAAGVPQVNRPQTARLHAIGRNARSLPTAPPPR